MKRGVEASGTRHEVLADPIQQLEQALDGSHPALSVRTHSLRAIRDTRLRQLCLEHRVHRSLVHQWYSLEARSIAEQRIDALAAFWAAKAASISRRIVSLQSELRSALREESIFHPHTLSLNAPSAKRSRPSPSTPSDDDLLEFSPAVVSPALGAALLASIPASSAVDRAVVDAITAQPSSIAPAAPAGGPDEPSLSHSSALSPHAASPHGAAGTAAPPPSAPDVTAPAEIVRPVGPGRPPKGAPARRGRRSNTVAAPSSAALASVRQYFTMPTLPAGVPGHVSWCLCCECIAVANASCPPLAASMAAAPTDVASDLAQLAELSKPKAMLSGGMAAASGGAAAGGDLRKDVNAVQHGGMKDVGSSRACGGVGGKGCGDGAPVGASVAL